MDLGISDKTALVTGSSRGLGRSIAKSLAEEAVHTFISARSKEDLDGAAKEISSSTGTPVTGISADLGDPLSVAELGQQLLAEVGRIDIFVHVVGGPGLGRFIEKDGAEWDEQFQLHFHSFRQLVSELLPPMIEHGWGRVIAVASRTVKRPRVDNVLSGAVRLPTISALRVLATEYSSQGITFNAVCPGPFATDRLRAVCMEKAETEQTTIEEQLAAFGGDVAVGRLGKPEELGAVCAFLASERASFVTGQVIMVDGGSVETIF